MNDITIPKIAENVEKGTVISVLVSEGDSVTKDDPVLEVESDKAAVDVPSGYSGIIKEILVSENDEVKVGQTVMKIEASEEASAGEKPAKAGEKEEPEPRQEQEPQEKEPLEEPAPQEAKPLEEPEPAESRSSSDKIQPVPASPSTRRLAREIGIEIHRVAGSGPGGRISKEDVKSFAKTLHKDAQRKEAKGIPASEIPDFSRWGKTERVQLSGIRAVIAENTEKSWRTIPHVTQFDKADIGGVEEFRKKFGKISLTSIIVKISAHALLRFPRFNATFDAEKKELIVKKYVNIGVAVDTDRGLLVPVVRDADKKSITEIAEELKNLAERSRNKKIDPEELEGGNFIVSNLGGIGGTNFTPVIFPHQVAILAVARAEVRPIYIDGSFVPRSMLPLGLSYDHRVIDGADGARFLRWTARSLEEPLYMHLEGGKE